jgi:hypothetical protein
MKLYTKTNCKLCEVVKAYLTTRDDLNIEILTDFKQDYSDTYPTLVFNDKLYITKSLNIISFLKTLKIK